MLDSKPANLTLAMPNNLNDTGSDHRSVSVSPQPYQHSPSPHNQELSSGEGEQEASHFGKAKKPKRKAAPRTSRACLACRRQKMRCEGAEDPPCRRCIANEVDCMFERRSDYLLNPEDRAWQNGVEKRLEQLGRAVDQILAQLGGPYMNTGMGAPPNTAGGFADIQSTAFYEHQHQYDARNGQSGGMMMNGPPNTAPIDSNMAGPRVNYVVPTPSETAAIAAQARFKRPRGNTMPSPLSSSMGPNGVYTPGVPDSAPFQLFSPRTAALDATNGLPTPYSFTGPQQQQQPAPYSHSSSYSFDTYQSNDNSHVSELGSVAVPRSLNSPSVRFAPPPVPLLQAAPAPGVMNQNHAGQHEGEAGA